MTIPEWTLALVYWIHMIATVFWIGSLAVVALVILPLANKNLTAQDYSKFLNSIQQRLDPVGWFSLATLAATGLIQMSANPNYQGFLSIQSRWAAAIFFKHLLYLLMIVNSAYLTWNIFPKIRRASFLDIQDEQKAKIFSKGENAASITNLRRQEILLIWVNLLLGFLILALTAIARASN